MLSDFFRVNMPYGLAKDEKTGGWYCFNREYVPIGFNKTKTQMGMEPNSNEAFTTVMITHYEGLTEKVLLDICDGGLVRRNTEGDIVAIWLYEDATNPLNSSGAQQNLCFERYFVKLKKLSKLKVMSSSKVEQFLKRLSTKKALFRP